MQIELRDPKKIMKLKRLGSFHQSKLSFLRSFLREFNSWDYKHKSEPIAITIPTLFISFIASLPKLVTPLSIVS